jgi:hypothetical protein
MVAMPRGSQPGERRGGRQPGTPNRKTALVKAAFAAAASDPGLSPLDFLLGVMRDSSVAPELRIRAAQAAAPYVHAKAGPSQVTDPAASAKQIAAAGEFIIEPGVARILRDDRERLSRLCNRVDGSLSSAEEQEVSDLRKRIAETATGIRCPAGYGPREAEKDRDRLHTIFSKRRSRASGAGDTLTEAEIAEEAQLAARVAAYDESPEARARGRILKLTFDHFSRSGLTDAEVAELESLRKIYPDLPPDPDDPLKDVSEAWGRAAKEYGRVERSGAGSKS